MTSRPRLSVKSRKLRSARDTSLDLGGEEGVGVALAHVSGRVAATAGALTVVGAAVVY